MSFALQNLLYVVFLTCIDVRIPVVSHDLLLVLISFFVSCLKGACLSSSVFVTSFLKMCLSCTFVFLKFLSNLIFANLLEIWLYWVFYSSLYIVVLSFFCCSGQIKNCIKWSEIEKVRLPLTSDSLKLFVKILSISVPEWGVILVGIVICWDKDPEYVRSKKFLVWACDIFKSFLSL